jgi:hypothetical protein
MSPEPLAISWWGTSLNTTVLFGRILEILSLKPYMKTILRSLLPALLGLLILIFLLPGCYESHYYHHHHHHSRDWYDRHHQEPPADINFDVEVHKK